MITILSLVEVWAFLIPISFWLRYRGSAAYFLPIKVYLATAFLLNLIANLISNQKRLGYTLPWHNNVALYNLHSIVRLLLFCFFFISLKQRFVIVVKYLIPIFFLAFTIYDFCNTESFYKIKISSRVHLVETVLLLFLCLQYYLFVLKEDAVSFATDSSFWIVTGLSIFVVCSFPVYLFYDTVLHKDTSFATVIWQIQKVALLCFCIFLSKAFYVSR